MKKRKENSLENVVVLKVLQLAVGIFFSFALLCLGCYLIRFTDFQSIIVQKKTRKIIIWKTIKCLTERTEQAYGTVFLFILIFPQLIFFNQKTVISGYLIRDFFLIFDDGIHSKSKIKKL